jgi:hypothetical protein
MQSSKKTLGAGWFEHPDQVTEVKTSATPKAQIPPVAKAQQSAQAKA